MKVKEVVLETAKLLELSEVEEYVTEGLGNGKEEAGKLVSCFNRLEKDLALNYVPLIMEDSFMINNGCVVYKDFPQNPLRIISVADEKGKRLPFQIFPTEICVETDEKTVIIKYAYIPEEKSLLDDSDYETYVSIALMAYGVAAEYCATRGLYEEAAFWDKKYKESVAKSYTFKRGGRMQSRKWV